ncbi:MAG: MarR family winged helix-turn-helix transcriptional regulator [Alphaproteobacteria bacterium]
MPDPDANFGFIINDVARLLRRRFDQRAHALGLTRAQWRALRYIGRQEGIHQAALAELLEVEPISLARLVDRLEAGGFVERRHDPADRRTWRLFLTAKVHPILERMKELALETLGEAFVGFEGAEIAALSKALARIKGNLVVHSNERERKWPQAGGRP